MKYLPIIEAYFGRPISDYVFIDSWWDFDVCIVNGFVFRFPKSEEKRLWMKQEKVNLDKIKPYISINIPQIDIIDNKYMIYPLISWMPFNDVKSSYSDDIILQIIWFTKELHNIHLSIFWYNDSKKDSKDDARWFAEYLKNDMESKLSDSLSIDKIKLIKNYIEELFFVYESNNIAFVHTDLQGKNMIFDKQNNELSWIIDFTDARIWWIELDFCHFYEAGEDVLRKFVEQYKWTRDQDFFDRIFFLSRRSVIFEVNNNDLFYKQKDYLFEKLRRYKFI